MSEKIKKDREEEERTTVWALAARKLLEK